MGKGTKTVEKRRGFDLPEEPAPTAAPPIEGEVLPHLPMAAPLKPGSRLSAKMHLRGGPRWREAKMLMNVDAVRAVERMIEISKQDDDLRSATVATQTLLHYTMGKPVEGRPIEDEVPEVDVSTLTDEELATMHRLAAKLAGVALDDDADDDGQGEEREPGEAGDSEVSGDDA